MLKKLLFVSTLIFISYFTVSAQTTPLEKSTHQLALKAVELLNKKMTDSLYSMTGESFRKTISPTLWQSISKGIFPLLPLRDLAFESSKDSVSKYQIQGPVALLMYISIDKAGMLKNIVFRPGEQKVAALEMSPEAKRTDSVARKMVRLINEKQVDSTYLLFAENFKKYMNSEVWKNSMEKSIYPLLPFTEFTFRGNTNNISKYKSGPVQFLIAASAHRSPFHTPVKMG